MMQDPRIPLHETQKAFDDYFDGRTRVRGDGYNVFKRWAHWMEKHVDEYGLLPPAGTDLEAYRGFMHDYNLQRTGQPPLPASAQGNWNPLGARNTLKDWSGFGIGVGRIDILKQDPFDPNTFYAGAPSGGLWKSTDHCATWQPTGTDSLPTMGVASIAMHPTEPDHLFIGTGDRDASGTRSIGVLESFDGGDTWQMTGLTYQLFNFEKIYDLLIHPTQPDTMYAGTFQGVFRSYDGGAGWTQVWNGYAMDIEFKPNDPSTLFVVYRELWRSDDNGDNWTPITNGLPNPNFIRKAQIAVTPANPDVVYYHCCNYSPSTFYGIFRSDDGGNTFAIGATSPNMYGYDQNGLDSAGQTGYNMAIAVNDTNANDVIIAGIRPWRSLDGGQTFAIMTDYNLAYVHADVHWLSFYGNEIYCCSDGGISRTLNNGQSWEFLNDGLQITQYNRIGLSATKEYLLVGGAQDNGTSRLNDTLWTFIRGADGGQCLVSPTDTNLIWASTQWGGIAKSYNGGVTFSNVINPETGDFLAPMVMHPANDDTLWLGRRDIWRTYDAGATWTQISSFSTDYIEAMDVSDLNTDYIYVSSDDQTYMTPDGGATWIDIGAGLPVIFSPSGFEISEDNPQSVWLTMENYYAGDKVFFSTNGGLTWINISGNLPNTPVNCIVHEAGSPNRVYIGTDLGVFVRDNNMTGWQPFNQGMPLVPVNDLEIYYPADKLRAATYGMGIWESDLYTAPTTVAPLPAVTPPFSVHPNPTPGEITISGTTGDDFMITDATGKLVRQGKVNVTLNLSRHAPGVYQVTVNGVTQKFILEN